MMKVIIEVSGGVAEVTQCPPGIDVVIIDHDNENYGDDDTPSFDTTNPLSDEEAREERI